MGRKVASQVHNAATRLMQGKLLSEPPLWYSAVAQYPPLPLPPRRAVRRNNLDLPPGSRATETAASISTYTHVIYFANNLKRKVKK
jgi:hypothetical protein